MHKINADWLVGFIDGEGSFFIVISRNEEMKLGFQTVPVFTVSAHERDKGTILAVKDYFGFGTTPISKQPNKMATGNVQRYYARAASECFKIRDFFDQHPLQTKYKSKQFKLWSQCLDLIKNKKHLTVDGFLKIVSIRDCMGRKGQHKGYRTAQFLRKYFNENKSI